MTECRPYGPDNPHPLSQMKTELVWEGKYDEYGNRRQVKLPQTPLPLQKIETIDEPRDRSKALQLPFDEEQAHRDDFRNMLIWGDNKLAMASLLEQFRGKIDLIYIDPPFAVGADFTVDVQIGEEADEVLKEHSVLEEVAYRDTWGKGLDSYLQMMYERLTIMRDLLSPDGALFVHCDYRVNSHIRLILDDVLGADNLRNEIVSRRAQTKSLQEQFASVRSLNVFHDTIYCYSKAPNARYAGARKQATAEQRHGTWQSMWNNADRPTMRYPLLGCEIERGQWKWNQQRAYDAVANYAEYEAHYAESMTLEEYWEHTGRKKEFIRRRGTGRPEYWVPPRDLVIADTNWFDIPGYSYSTGYDTEKSEALLERIVTGYSNEGDLVADFFCGSGTTMAVAEKLGRRWIGVDLGRYAIHVTRKRLIQVQRELHGKGQPYRSFDVYNLGRYERQWWQFDRLRGADDEHRRVVLRFYKAAELTNPPSPLLHGKKNGAYVHVDKIDGIFTFEELREVAFAAQGAGARELHCLAWEFEMELAHKKQAIEAETGLTIRLKYIPREIMEPNRNEVQFFEAGYLQARAVNRNGKVDVELTDFSPALAEVPEKEMEVLLERAVKSPFDFIDFWAVDFEWRDGKPFEHHWQDFRTRKDRSLKTKTDIGWQYQTKGKHQICVKVIDVFGIDTTTIIEVEV